jgi:hypothetical protein
MLERPYKLFGAHERAAMEKAVDARVSAWRAAWLADAAGIECAPAPELAARLAGCAGEWRASVLQNGDSIALRSDETRLAGALCGRADAGDSPYARHVAEEALRELAAALLGSREAKAAKGLPEDAWLPGSACYACHIQAGAARIGVVSNAAWTLRLLRALLPRPPGARLVERRAAVADQRLEVRAVAGWADLQLGVLRGLDVGNVIALEARLDRPVNLATPSGAVLCSARLGQREGHKAVSLAAVGRGHG